MNVWQHVSTVYIDALRDVESELRKPKNPIRQIINTIEGDIDKADIDEIKKRIIELNKKIAGISQVSNIGDKVNCKLLEMIGAIYSPEIKLESRLKEDFATLARYLTISPSNQKDIDLLGLGHLNVLYIALKLVEFEVNRNRELLNIMIIEEPEAHIHTHIQKTLFDNLQVADTYTQVIMSTHSTHLSEVSDIEKVNVMKKINETTSLVMKPTTGLDQFGSKVLEHKMPFTKVLSRYLDAKRSVLLFSKGVILVEGDGEEILIPALVKKVLGVSLDEMGIGLINIGSVGFENVACIFHKSRLQRNCSIITDSDAVVDGAGKSSTNAMNLGTKRKQKLDKLFEKNPYVNAYYAPHTLEVDFAKEENNKKFIIEIINNSYKDEKKIGNHISNILLGSEAEHYDSVMTVVEHIQKGWYATLLAETIDETAVIPEYILNAISFAAEDILSDKLMWKMVQHTFKCYEQAPKYKNLKMAFDTATSSIDKNKTIKKFCDEIPESMVSKFISNAGVLNDK